MAFEVSSGNVRTRQKTHTRQKSREGKGRGGRENCEGIVRGVHAKKQIHTKRGESDGKGGSKNTYTQKKEGE